MAVHFPDTIVWSPDSATVAFVAMLRAGQTGSMPVVPNSDTNTNANAANKATADSANANAETNAETNSSTNGETNAAPTAPVSSVPEPAPVLTFRTEQIYICDAQGNDLKPVTQNEGLIYFYYVWSPDSQMLAAMATTFREWQFLQYQSDSKGEVFVPQGRPRLVEKTGRERRLDDNLTAVRPVWSPDSAKVAVGFLNQQIRIYDAIGETPSQAAIQLRNQLLISSKTYDEGLIKQEAANSNAAVNEVPTPAPTPANQTVSTLPDENSLVSFNPIINLEWTQDSLLYFQTGYVKEMKNASDSARSYLRWHRLVLSPQAVSLK